VKVPVWGGQARLDSIELKWRRQGAVFDRVGPAGWLAAIALAGSVACGSRTGLLAGEDAGSADAPAPPCDGGKILPLSPPKARFLFLVDTSGSMGGERWAAAVKAMSNLFADPRSTGLSIGLTFYPLTSGSCEAASYEQPAVALGELTSASAPEDAHEALLLAALAQVLPTGSNPIAPAVEGTLAYLANQPPSPELGPLSLVVVTDGTPGGCIPFQFELEIVTQAAKAAHASPARITTHVIAIGEDAPVAEMTAFAAAGGGQALFVEASEILDTLLYDALVETTRRCAIALPEALTGGLALVGPGSQVAHLVEVASASACDVAPLAWYRETSGAQSVAVLCPETCHRAAEVDVHVVTGCS
jgi:hypothetical protein